MADSSPAQAPPSLGNLASIADPPMEKQAVSHDGAEFTTVKEGLAYILVPHIPTLNNPRAPKDDGPHQSVFYNPIQQFNRDLSVLAIRVFGEDLLDSRRRKAEKTIKRQKSKKSKRNQANAEGADAGKCVDATPDTCDTHLKRKNECVEEQNQSSNMGNCHDEKRPKLDNGQTENSVQNPGSEEAKDGPTDTGQKLPVPIAGDAGDIDISEQIADEDLIAFEKSLNRSPTTHNECVPSGEQTDNQPITPKSTPFRILDALSATGLRALRYAQEIPFVTSITANDMSLKATQSIALNIRHNKLENIIKPNTGNAMAHMYSLASHDDISQRQPKYDVIDLDPYGTAAPFLDAALHAINDNGLLCVTCTDASIFNSASYPEKTYALYGGLPTRGFHGHEVGLRLILHSIATTAARYGIAIEPMLSLSIDYYARVFVRIRKSPAEVKLLAGKQMIVYECDHGCGAWQTQFLARNQTRLGKDGKPFYKHTLAQGPTSSSHCEHCGKKTHLVGPMYGGPLHNPRFIRKILNCLPELEVTTYGTIDRIEGMLHTALEETSSTSNGSSKTTDQSNDDSKNDQEDPAVSEIARVEPSENDPHPFYFVPSHLARILHCRAPSDSELKGALRHAGFRVTRSHCKPGTVKTDAPWGAIWHIMREWVRQRAPLKDGLPKEGTAGFSIMQKPKNKSEDEGAFGNDAPSKDISKGEDTDVAMVDAVAVDEQKHAAGSATFDFPVVFDEKLGRDKDTKRLVRYQLNPRADWGPMKRAK